MYLSDGAAEAKQSEVQRHVVVAQAEDDEVAADAGDPEQVREVVEAAPEVHPAHGVQRRRVLVLPVNLVLRRGAAL